MPRKTDSSKPADWLYIAESDLAGLRKLAVECLSYEMCRSKLAEVLEKVLKAELIRLGWRLVKTHDLQVLALELQNRNSELVKAAVPLCNALAEAYYLTRNPGFDDEEPDWPQLRAQIEAVAARAQQLKARLGTLS